MRKSLTLWLCVLILGATVAAVQQAGDAADRIGTWTGTWEGGGGTGGLEPRSRSRRTARSPAGSRSPGAHLQGYAQDGDHRGQQASAVYDFPAADGAEVVLAATFEGNACKGTWVLREKANGNPALDGTWSVAKK